MGERFSLELLLVTTTFVPAGTPRKGVSVRPPKMLSARCSAGHVLSTISTTRPEDMWVCVGCCCLVDKKKHIVM